MFVPKKFAAPHQFSPSAIRIVLTFAAMPEAAAATTAKTFPAYRPPSAETSLRSYFSSTGLPWLRTPKRCPSLPMNTLPFISGIESEPSGFARPEEISTSISSPNAKTLSRMMYPVARFAPLRQLFMCAAWHLSGRCLQKPLPAFRMRLPSMTKSSMRLGFDALASPFNDRKYSIE